LIYVKHIVELVAYDALARRSQADYDGIPTFSPHHMRGHPMAELQSSNELFWQLPADILSQPDRTHADQIAANQRKRGVSEAGRR